MEELSKKIAVEYFLIEQQEHDYQVLLKILLLVTLKIIDDFYLHSSKKNWS